MAPLRASLERSASTAWLRRVMSRPTAETPTTAPARSRMGESVTETSTSVPSLRTFWVSTGSTDSPRRTCSWRRPSSAMRSAGTIRVMSRPMASAAG